MIGEAIAAIVGLSLAFAGGIWLGWTLRRHHDAGPLQTALADRAAWIDLASELFRENVVLRRVALEPEQNAIAENWIGGGQ